MVYDNISVCKLIDWEQELSFLIGICLESDFLNHDGSPGNRLIIINIPNTNFDFLDQSRLYSVRLLILFSLLDSCSVINGLGFRVTEVYISLFSSLEFLGLNVSTMISLVARLGSWMCAKRGLIGIAVGVLGGAIVQLLSEFDLEVVFSLFNFNIFLSLRISDLVDRKDVMSWVD